MLQEVAPSARDVATVTAALEIAADLPDLWAATTPVLQHQLLGSIAPAGVAVSIDGSIELSPAPFWSLVTGQTAPKTAIMEKAAPGGDGLVPYGDPDET